VDLSDVLWIGGATGAGKTTIARALACRHALQLYNVDHRTYEHVNRAGADPRPRWDLPPGELADRFVAYSYERFPLILDDLRALPPSPGAIAEGPFLLPSLLRRGAAAVFLAPSPERIRATAAERTTGPVVVERNLLLARRIRDEAEAAGFPVLDVDRPLDAMVELVDAQFTDAIARLPRGGDLAQVRRLENDALARQVSLYRSSGDAPPQHLDVPLSFACECGRPGCDDVVEVGLETYLSAGGDRSPLRRPRS
jgi:hypothetical protein